MISTFALPVILGWMGFSILFGIFMGIHDLYTRKRLAEMYEKRLLKKEARHRRYPVSLHRLP